MAYTVKGKTYNQLSADFNRGKLDPYEALAEYRKIYHAAMTQLGRIRKSDVPITNEVGFLPPSKINSTSDLLHALADIERFKRSGNYRLKDRRAKRDRSIETLERRGIDFVNKSNYTQFADFMRMFHAAGLQRLFDSDDQVVEDFFIDRGETLGGLSDTKKQLEFRRYARVWMKENGG